MTSIDLITLLGGTGWLAILIIRQQAAFRTVTKSQQPSDTDES
jgi:hypothetical protein